MGNAPDPKGMTEAAPLPTAATQATPLPTAATQATPLSAAVPSAASAPTHSAPELIAGRYELLGLLGGGAMGTVYRARDRELDEILALKMLKRELASSPGMIERFRREVKLARRVTHRNVARTYDIGEHGGDRFLTMELIEGEILAARIARRGRLAAGEVVALARDVCAGLSAAHAAGVLHRDLKPENVVVAESPTETGGRRAVITDFGIARALAEASAGRTLGGFVGTPAYMAPEQVEGASDLDARADLYALGAMLYEMLTGALAWSGDSVVAVAAARLLKPPPDARALAPDVPEPLAALVLRLMARRREDRFASADAVVEALASLEGVPLARASGALPSVAAAVQGAREAPARSVAVLPVLNVGPSEDEYLAQSVTEDLVDLLSVVPALRVRPRGLTVRYAEAARDVREAGRALDVDVVVDASMRRVGEVVRVSVRLVTVDDGFQLWARRFDRPPARVLDVADEAADAIARALATERAAAALPARPAPVDDRAQDLYLRGRFILHRGWHESKREAVGLLREAHARAPGDARIAGTYALAVARAYGVGREADEADALEARTAADRALALNPEQGEAHAALAQLHLAVSEGAASAIAFRRALASSPNDVDALECTGRMLLEIGRAAAGERLLQRALEVEPDLLQPKVALARTRVLLGDLGALEELTETPPEHAGDLPMWLLACCRMLCWVPEPGAAEAGCARLEAVVAARGPIPETARASLSAMLDHIRSRTFGEQSHGRLNLIPVEGRQTARRVSNNAQLRAEVFVFTGREAEAVEALHLADANGLYDLEWLERCPLLQGLRDRADLAPMRANVTARAQRIAEALGELAR